MFQHPILEKVFGLIQCSAFADSACRSNGNFTQDLADLKAGEYTVLVKDLNGVGVTASITLTQPGSIEVDLTAPTYPNGHHTTCYNCSNGSVTTTVTGGVMPYTYSWNTGQNTQNLS
ncbi:MAG: SprB repeat-containing protein, partial [Bacteroidia bacterium]|nr:SprB repeat-containing protein [Bacteroidia bacterium]